MATENTFTVRLEVPGSFESFQAGRLVNILRFHNELPTQSLTVYLDEKTDREFHFVKQLAYGYQRDTKRLEVTVRCKVPADLDSPHLRFIVKETIVTFFLMLLGTDAVYREQ